MIELRLVALFGLATLATAATAQDKDLAARVEALGRINSATSPSLSPDGTRLAYLSNASGSPQIWIRDLRTNTAVQRTACE